MLNMILHDLDKFGIITLDYLIVPRSLYFSLAKNTLRFYGVYFWEKLGSPVCDRPTKWNHNQGGRDDKTVPHSSVHVLKRFLMMSCGRKSFFFDSSESGRSFESLICVRQIDSQVFFFRLRLDGGAGQPKVN